MAENYTVETDIIYEGNGTVKEFPITFSFSDENEVVVYLNGEVIRRGYSIDGDSVVFNVAPADGDEIALAKATVDAPEEEESSSGESSESGSDTVYDQASREHIKINPVPAKVKYSGNGEVTEFPTGFAFFENDNIIVYLNGAIINSGYSITGVGETEGGSVIFDEAPKEGDKIVILRQVPIERVTDFQEGGAFRAKNINDELDRQTAFCQQIQEQIDRCVKVEVTDDQTPEELLAEVYGKLDSATEVAQEAVDAATAATDAVASAEKTLAEVNTYVDESKAEIDALITKTTEEIDQTIADATEEIKEVAVNAANEAVQETIGTSVIEAATSAEHARIWAEGEQAEVQPLGGELSSMGAADLAYALANAPEDTPIDASGLFAMNVVKGEKGDKGDKGDKGTDGKDGADGKDGVDGKSVFDGYATNCITEIPQDIKVELNNGVLTLKAGSKVYVPNGFEADGVTPKFDYVIIESDLSTNTGWAPSGQNFLFYDSVNKTLSMYAHNFANCSIWSGDSPTIDKQYGMWFNTTNNIIQNTNNTGSSWAGKFSLPLTIYTCDSNKKPASIEQIFNGFGYIGSTVFALPNVKGLIPNGRNADGSLNNIEFTVDSVWLGQTAYNANKATLGVVPTLKILNYVTYNNVVYNEEENKNRQVDNGDHWRGCLAGSVAVSDMKFTSLTPKQAFHAVDRNDSSWIAGQAMPSGKYIDLTLGASGSAYTAPANGWFVFRRTSTAAGQFLQLVNENSGKLQHFIYSSATNQIIGTSIPVKKGDLVVISYSVASTANQMFRFIYAEGEN